MDTAPAVSKRTSMIVGARRHLEAGHEKYILDTIHSHPAQVCYQLNCSIGDFVHLLSSLFRILKTNSIRIIDVVFMVKKGSVDISCGQINVQLLLSIIIGSSSLCLVFLDRLHLGVPQEICRGCELFYEYVMPPIYYP